MVYRGVSDLRVRFVEGMEMGMRMEWARPHEAAAVGSGVPVRRGAATELVRSSVRALHLS